MASRTKQIGNIGEQVLIAEFVKKGVTVLTPIGDNEPFDFVIVINDKFLKVQVKTTERVKDGTMIFCTNITNPHKKINRRYSKSEIDLFGLYCIENGYIGLLPITDYTGKDTVIRLEKPKNNQINRVKMAENYEFERQFNILADTCE